MKKIIKPVAGLVLFLVLNNMNLNAQGVAINLDGSVANASAMLDIKSTDRGMLIPRISLSQTTSASPVSNPVVSLMVYNTATANDVTPGYYYWDGSKWVKLFAGNPNDYILNQTSSNQTAGFRISGNGFIAGYVGIGNTNTTYKLDVTGHIRGTGTLYISTDNTTGGGIKLADDGDIVDLNDGWATHRFSYGLRITNANSGGATVIQLANGGSGYTYFNSGNVGIGTSTPQNTLDVNGVANATTGYRVANAAASGTYLRGNGTNFVPSAIQAADLPASSGNYIQNQYSGAQSANMWISGTANAATYTFTAPAGDPAPVITARTVPSGQGAANEKTELILFHTNDPVNGSGVDQITLRAPGLSFQTYNNATVGDINNNAGYNERMYINPDGNIGIGTTSPGARVHVSAGDASLTLYGPNASWSGQLYVGAAPNQAAASTAQVISTDGNLHLDPAPSKNMYLGYYQPRDIYINPNGGNVGIGNAGPASKLDVTGGDIRVSSQGYGVYMKDETSGTNWQLHSHGDRLRTYNGVIEYTYLTTADFNSTISGTTNYVAKFTGANSIGNSVIYDNGTNVGIGTTTPQDKLDVRDAMSVNEIKFRNVGGGDDSDPYRMRKVQGSSNTNWLELQLNDDSNEEFRIYGNSCVGYGCAEYSGNLYHFFRADGTAYHSGNLGLGVLSPAYKLDVNGAANATNFWVGSGSYELTTSGWGSDRAIHIPAAANFRIYSDAGSTNLYVDGQYYANEGTNLVWNAGNDGAGSGSDADLLDGQHASSFLSTSNYGVGTVSADIAFSRDDISGWTTAVGSGADDAVYLVNLGFTITINGASYTQCYLSTNGNIQFGSSGGNSYHYNAALPTTSFSLPTLCFYWDDMVTTGNGIRYTTLGDAGNRVFIADFELTTYSTSYPVTVQVQIHENSNLMNVRYYNVSPYACGVGATIGFQANTSQAIPISCNAKVLDDNYNPEAISFQIIK